jgi:hypothetical protein
MSTTTETRPVHSTGREIYGIKRIATVGSIVLIDGRTISEELLAGEPEAIGDGWLGCDFRYPTIIGECACNVHVVGRTLQNHGGSLWVRVRVEWVGDCEPSTFIGGWLLIRN